MTLAETLVPRVPPLRQDPSGAVRVGETRITLDTVVHAYENGASAEEIMMAYDTLSLADVHAVISYYLQNREKVRHYLQDRMREAEEIRQKFPPKESWQTLRNRLIARGVQQQRDQG